MDIEVYVSMQNVTFSIESIYVEWFDSKQPQV